MKLNITIAALFISAAAYAEPITLTIIASRGSGAAFTNFVRIKDDYVPQDVDSFADKQGVQPRNNIVRRSGVLAKVLLKSAFDNTLPGLFNERQKQIALSNVVQQTSATTTEGDE